MVVIWGIILGVNNDADLENGICKDISQCLGVVLVGIYLNRVVFDKVFMFPNWIMFGIVLGLKGTHSI